MNRIIYNNENNDVLFTKIILKEDFPNGFTLSQFANELNNINGLICIDEYSSHIICKFNLLIDESKIVTIINNHIPVNLTDIEIHQLKFINEDYFTVRNEMKNLITDFNTLNINEKEIVCKYCLVEDETIILYYIQSGLTQEQAITKHKVRRSIDINKASESCKIRANSDVVKYITIKYLSEANGASFLDAIRNFMEDYKSIAHLGINYGQSREGLMDYIEATNAYDNAGLSQYIFNTPFTYEQCKTEFKNYLVYGIEPIEFNEFST